MSTKLSKNFSLEELYASQTASRLGIDNKPTKAVQANLQLLVDTILQPLRDKLGKPITISSGYRSPRLNDAVPGSSKTSAHCFGYAVDMNSFSYGNTKKFCEYVHKFLIDNNIPFDQLIYEYGQWVHIGIKNRSGGQRRQLISAKRVSGKTVYVPGIQD
jgi:hypothetical protein